MLKTVIILPDGTELSSGVHSHNAIQSSTFIESVNSGEKLTLGSACASSLELKIFAPGGDFTVPAGEEIVVYKESADGSRYKVGVFTCERPERKSANTFRLLAYDHIVKLDKDISAWLKEFTGWGCNLHEFAQLVCEQCGVGYSANPDIVNNGFKVPEFFKSGATGRQIMRWLGEICCSFCRANADGNIEFRWYARKDADITATGDLWYFANSLTYEDYATDPVDGVKVRLADAEGGALWPQDNVEYNNLYVLSGNPILVTDIGLYLNTEGQEYTALQNICTRLLDVRYTPCKVSIQASIAIRAGDVINITDLNGKQITAYVMTKTQTGQKDTFECTGSPNRSSSAAANNKTVQEMVQDAIDAQTGQDIFSKLTNNGKVQGIYQKDGRWYINCEVANVVNFAANLITSGLLQSTDGATFFDLDSARIVTRASSGSYTSIGAGSIFGYGKNGMQLLALFGFDDDQSGNLQLGKCSISGTDVLKVRTASGLNSENRLTYPAKWIPVKCEDLNGNEIQIIALAADPTSLIETVTEGD